MHSRITISKKALATKLAAIRLFTPKRNSRRRRRPGRNNSSGSVHMSVYSFPRGIESAKAAAEKLFAKDSIRVAIALEILDFVSKNQITSGIDITHNVFSILSKRIPSGDFFVIGVHNDGVSSRRVYVGPNTVSQIYKEMRDSERFFAVKPLLQQA